jgi:Carboxyltransferase domain, subdomain C and D
LRVLCGSDGIAATGGPATGQAVRQVDQEILPKTLTLACLGDQAALAYLADEDAALRFAAAVRDSHEPWLVDVVQAYTSVAVYFDLEQSRFAKVAGRLRALLQGSGNEEKAAAGQLHLISCCYEFGPDLERVASHTGLAPQEVVRRHAAATYTVYAIGFCPGFPYLGYLPPELSGVARGGTPRGGGGDAAAAGRSRECRLDRSSDWYLYRRASGRLEPDRPDATGASKRC